MAHHQLLKAEIKTEMNQFNIQDLTLVELENLLNDVQERISFLESEPIMNEEEETKLAIKLQQLIDQEAEGNYNKYNIKLYLTINEWKWKLYQQNLISEDEYNQSISKWNGVAELILPNI